jgi:hypothetical protein
MPSGCARLCVQDLPIRPLPRNDPKALGVEAFKQLVLQPTTAFSFAGIAGELHQNSLHQRRKRCHELCVPQSGRGMNRPIQRNLMVLMVSQCEVFGRGAGASAWGCWTWGPIW